MKYLAALVVAVFASGASAQGFVDSPTCYSWEGGRGSAGSFSKCSPELMAAAKPAPKVVPAPLAAPPTANPVMVPMQQTCAPPPKPVVKKKRPPPPKC